MRTEIAPQVRPQGSQPAPANHRKAVKPFELERISSTAELNRLFRSGEAPDTRPYGFYDGALVAIRVAPLLDPALEWIVRRWRPWYGKTFEAAQATGINIVSESFRGQARWIFPGYRRYAPFDPTGFRAFPFVTYLAPGLKDPDRRVLKIDYNLDANPRLSVRRILDELVRLEDGFFLGKAHVKWWWGSWQTVAYFTLSRENA
jgi:hypothetical protein